MFPNLTQIKKEVVCVIVKDERTGKSTNYGTTKEEMRRAYDHVKTIEANGHRASGEGADRAKNFARQMGWQ
ncbi:hypothetical protein IJ096_00495 [Candidatus Saccharibacteria bacterium]|nr:hypothetical protein [Candidatus Saccharibacteria bacterium]